MIPVEGWMGSEGPCFGVVGRFGGGNSRILLCVELPRHSETKDKARLQTLCSLSPSLSLSLSLSLFLSLFLSLSISVFHPATSLCKIFELDTNSMTFYLVACEYIT
jgi:hypothetical protein